MRARNMQSLTDAIKRRHPGVVIYGVGDAAHKLRISDHNEDDTAGSRAAQSDADSTPEHRAIDVMLGPAFTEAQAYQLIDDLLEDPAALARLKYIIFDGWIWSRANGWKKVAFDGDPHRDHPHISGWAADDENAAAWPAVDGDDMELSDTVGVKAGAFDPRTGPAIGEGGVVQMPAETFPVSSGIAHAERYAYLAYRHAAAASAKADAISVPAPAPVDAAALKAVLLDPEVLAAIGAAVVDATRGEYND